MVEIIIVAGVGGVKKTQIVGPASSHPDGFRLYQKILPGIQAINSELRRNEEVTDEVCTE